ncbi:MAG: DUF86 domain-containing protein [Blastocatellales bacterium]
MLRDYKTCLEDISEAIGKIGRYASGHTRETLAADEKTLDAVIRNLEIIGEAIKNVPDDVRASYPEVEWKRIAGLRDILIHRYFGIDQDIIWDILQNKLPTLAAQIKHILESLDSPPRDISGR